LEVVAMPNQSVSIELTPDGYTVSCTGTHVTGYGRTDDFWATYLAQWKPPTTVTAPNGLLRSLQRRRIPRLSQQLLRYYP
jgi:hypothetical protein